MKKETKGEKKKKKKSEENKREQKMVEKPNGVRKYMQSVCVWGGVDSE